MPPDVNLSARVNAMREMLQSELGQEFQQYVRDEGLAARATSSFDALTNTFQEWYRARQEAEEDRQFIHGTTHQTGIDAAEFQSGFQIGGESSGREVDPRTERYLAAHPEEDPRRMPQGTPRHEIGRLWQRAYALARQESEQYNIYGREDEREAPALSAATVDAQGRPVRSIYDSFAQEARPGLEGVEGTPLVVAADIDEAGDPYGVPANKVSQHASTPAPPAYKTSWSVSAAEIGVGTKVLNRSNGRVQMRRFDGKFAKNLSDELLREVAKKIIQFALTNYDRKMAGKQTTGTLRRAIEAAEVRVKTTRGDDGPLFVVEIGRLAELQRPEQPDPDNHRKSTTRLTTRQYGPMVFEGRRAIVPRNATVLRWIAPGGEVVYRKFAHETLGIGNPFNLSVSQRDELFKFVSLKME